MNDQHITFDFGAALNSPNTYNNTHDSNDDAKKNSILLRKEEERLLQQRKRELHDDARNTSFGLWKRRKGKSTLYTSLTGEELIGHAARNQASLDERIIAGDIISERRMLEENIIKHPNYPISYNNNYNNLLSWGIPLETINLYKNISGIDSLYQWQIDCLLNDNAQCLKGKNIIYTQTQR
jgi:hypothetical protein